METADQVKSFARFIEKNYHAELLDQIRKGNKFLVIDYAKFASFNPELAELLLDNPEEVMKIGEIAVSEFDVEGDIKNFAVRFRNLPSSQKIMIRNIRSSHLGKFITTVGVVRQKSDVRPQVTASRFECPSCGNIIGVLQLDKKLKEPSKCGCGRKGKFRLLSKEMVDAQGLTLEEAPEELEGGEQPKRMNVFLKNDLVSPMSEKRTNPGSKIILNGVIKEVPIILRTGGQSTRFDLLIEANCIEQVAEDYSDINISKEELEQIKELSRDQNVYRKLTNSIAPNIYGHTEIKEALVYQLAGGVRKVHGEGAGTVTRGDIHVLLVGDPGSGKSALLKRINLVAPKARYVSGKGVTGAGLTAAVVKDEFLQGWSLEAGALVLANKGQIMIDELDKMSNEDRSALHEGLEQQTISIAKANIQATLRCETTVLAAANPKLGRFDPYSTIAEQINLPPTLINRFDLIFPIKDLPDAKKDERMASFILNLHQNPDIEETELETPFLRKYIAYARQNIMPKLTDAAIDEIKSYYLKMRSSGSTESSIKSIPISARQLEGLIRLSEAVAKVRLSDKITKKDAKRAINLLNFCLRQIAFDEETGSIDIDRIASEMPASQRSKIINVKEIISELEAKIGKTISIDAVVDAAKKKGISEEDAEEAIEKLKRTGNIFEPRPGVISRI